MDEKKIKLVAIIAACALVGGLYTKNVFFFSFGTGALLFTGVAAIVLWRQNKKTT